jgi:hypothetical protein
MYIVPRTPISPRRLSPLNMSSSTISNAPSVSISPTPSLEMDVYDKFAEIYFSVDMKIRNVLLRHITNYITHPVYTHLLRTMDETNSQYVMGYLRSQRFIELYDILNLIINSPLPTKEDFHRSTITY